MHYILEKIKEGEHEQLDFKFEITNSKKIARTLSAFSNTKGGKLLVGVKDNGVVTGVHTDEEYYMVEAAAKLYCKPVVEFQTKKWVVNGKTVLEITVPESDRKPVRAPDKSGKFITYVRINDESVIANNVLVRAMQNKQKESGVLIKYSETESVLLDYLSKNDKITIDEFRQIASISRYVAETIMSKLISLDIIEIRLLDKEWYYMLPVTETL